MCFRHSEMKQHIHVSPRLHFIVSALSSLNLFCSNLISDLGLATLYAGATERVRMGQHCDTSGESVTSLRVSFKTCLPCTHPNEFSENDRPVGHNFNSYLQVPALRNMIPLLVSMALAIL